MTAGDVSMYRKSIYRLAIDNYIASHNSRLRVLLPENGDLEETLRIRPDDM